MKHDQLLIVYSRDKTKDDSPKRFQWVSSSIEEIETFVRSFVRWHVAIRKSFVLAGM